VPSFVLAQNSGEPKAEVFGGYSWYRSGGTVYTVKVPDFTDGWAGQLIVNTGSWTAIVMDVNGHYNSFGNAHDFAIGPRFQMTLGHFRPFVEAMAGVQHLSPKSYPSQNDPTYIFGAGLDVKLTSRISVRPIQFSYVSTTYSTVGSQKSNYFSGTRVQAGLVYSLWVPSEGGTVAAVCSAEPEALDSGAAVKIGVKTTGFLPKRKLSYSYEATGGKIGPSATIGAMGTTFVDTTGVEPGSYTVSAKVVDNGRGKHRQTANCATKFSVNVKHPPVLSASANAAKVKPGDSVTITTSGKSEDNRPLSYGCTASGGQLSGNGPTYTLDTSGVATGKITVSCTATDDRNLSASSSTSVEVEAAAAPVAASEPPQAAKFGAVEFKHDLRRPTRVDNEAKGELDRYADALAAAPDANGVVVGYGTGKEKGADIAAQRAVNIKDYLNKGKGVDPARIQPRTGGGDEQEAELWIVPAGGRFAAEGTTVVDEGKVKAVPRVALKARRKGHRRGHKRTQGKKLMMM